MDLTRKTQLLNFTIQFNSPMQPVQGLPVVITSSESVVDSSGATVGHPQHAQKIAIKTDMTPELVDELNSALSYLGYALMPVGKK